MKVCFFCFVFVILGCLMWFFFSFVKEDAGFLVFNFCLLSVCTNWAGVTFCTYKHVLIMCLWNSSFFVLWETELTVCGNTLTVFTSLKQIWHWNYYESKLLDIKNMLTWTNNCSKYFLFSNNLLKSKISLSLSHLLYFEWERSLSLISWVYWWGCYWLSAALLS